jgi:hypothetical protein
MTLEHLLLPDVQTALKSTIATSASVPMENVELSLPSTRRSITLTVIIRTNDIMVAQASGQKLARSMTDGSILDVFTQKLILLPLYTGPIPTGMTAILIRTAAPVQLLSFTWFWLIVPGSIIVAYLGCSGKSLFYTRTQQVYNAG